MPDNTIRIDGLRPVELDDKPLFDQAFRLLKTPISDYTFANTYMWRSGLNLQWRWVEGFICVFSAAAGDLTMLLPPLGEGNLRACLRECFEIMDSYNSVVADRSHSRIEYVSEELLPALKEQGLAAAPMGGDYIYETAKMIELAGGDLKSKRQARSKFLREHQVRAEALEDRHVPECIDLLHRWRIRADEHGQSESPHFQMTVELRRRDALATELALTSRRALGLEGMVVYADDRLIGFTLGEELTPDQASILIEKTDLNVYGSAQYIFSEFCRRQWASYKECNVGDDWGIPSLRWTKESYRPIRLLAKYVLTKEATPMVGWTGGDRGGERVALAPVNPHHLTAAGHMTAQGSAGERVAIGAATIEDLDALAALEARAFAAGEAITRRQMRYLLRSPRALIHVARDDGRVVGWVIALLRRHFRHQTARIYSLAVDPGSRGAGIGERLLRSALAEIEKLGIGRCFLEVAQDNLTAKSLYERLGFAVVATLPHYYGPDRHGWRMLRLAGDPVKVAADLARPVGLV